MQSTAINNRAKPNCAIDPHKENFSTITNSGTNNAFSIVPYLAAPGQLNFYENQVQWRNFQDNNIFNNPPEREYLDIKTFSKKSRLRLFHLFTQLNYSEYGKPIFVTCTYHYDAPGSKALLKTFLTNYIKRLKRNLPAFHSIWKLEYQQRGTPHFHFMLLPLLTTQDLFSDTYEKIIKENWINYKPCRCKDCKIYSVKVKKIQEFKHAMIYISKELAKCQTSYELHDLGRIWGTSQNLRMREINNLKCTWKEWNELLKYILKNCELQDASKKYIQAMQNIGNSTTLFISYDELLPKLLQLKKKYIPKTIKTGKLKLRSYHFSE